MMFAQARERAAWARVGWRRRCTVRRSWTWRALTCATVTGRWRWRRWPSSARHVTDHAPPHPCSTAQRSTAQRSTAQLSSCVYSCSGCRIASSDDVNRVSVQITYGIPCRMVPDLMAESAVPTYPPLPLCCAVVRRWTAAWRARRRRLPCWPLAGVCAWRPARRPRRARGFRSE